MSPRRPTPKPTPKPTPTVAPINGTIPMSTPPQPPPATQPATQPAMRPKRVGRPRRATRALAASPALTSSPGSGGSGASGGDVRQMSPLMPWLINDWPARRAAYLQRIGEWVTLTMTRLRFSSHVLEDLAMHTGEPTSSPTLLRLASLRDVTDAANPRQQRVSLTTILWLATLSGQTLTDIARFLRSGDIPDLETSAETHADTLRGAYLALTPTHQQSLEDFAHHLY